MKLIKFLALPSVIIALASGVVLLATSGGAATAQTPTSGQAEAIIAQRSGLSLDTIHKLEAAYLSVAADKGAAQGILGADQANKIRNLTLGPVLDRGLLAATQATGATANELIESSSRGQTLAQIAAARGINRETLKSRLTTALDAELKLQQGAGLVTPVHAGLIMSGFKASLDRLIDASHTEHSHSR